MNPDQVREFGRRYAEAWSSRDPARLAACYAEGGWLKVNDGPSAVGRAAVAAKAQGFMSAFPDMIVTMTDITVDGERVVFRWTWTGTNTGPGGTGRAVHLEGFEEWTLDEQGLILASDGHFDEDEYRRQVGM
jgi:uncharacterized protein (TIGR02246 family)